MRTVIEVNNLVREYKVKIKKKKTIVNALKGINFNVEEGEIFGILGSNGAGKTTLTKILTTLLAPTSGEVKILNKDIHNLSNIRSNINFMYGGEKGVYPNLTGKEYLYYFYTLYKLPTKGQSSRVDEVLSLVDLLDKQNHKIYTYSKGMIQRLHFARALLNKPKILFLDEPTIGLDPVSAENVRDIITKLASEKVTILITTHYMREAEELCNRLAIINSGKILELGTPEEIISKIYQNTKMYEILTDQIINESIFNTDFFKNIKIKKVSELYSATFEIGTKINQVSFEQLLHSSLNILKFKEKIPSLEDAYIKLIKGEESVSI